MPSLGGHEPNRCNPATFAIQKFGHRQQIRPGDLKQIYVVYLCERFAYAQQICRVCVVMLPVAANLQHLGARCVVIGTILDRAITSQSTWYTLAKGLKEMPCLCGLEALASQMSGMHCRKVRACAPNMPFCVVIVKSARFHSVWNTTRLVMGVKTEPDP
jgi:hypothetical protein